MESHNWLEACPLQELPPGGRKLVKLHNIDIALFNIQGVIYAIKNRCPHRSGPLIRGFIDLTGGIKCPMHGWRFDLREGNKVGTGRLEREVDISVFHFCRVDCGLRWTFTAAVP